MTSHNGVARRCIRCGREITKCDGFVLARDLATWPARITPAPREQCQVCVDMPDAEQFLAMLLTRPMTAAERQRKRRAKDREGYNEYMRGYRARKRVESDAGDFE